MRYADISQHVLSRTHSLKVLPSRVVQDVIGYQSLYTNDINTAIKDEDFLRGVQDSRIECLTHSFKYTSKKDNYHVCTVLLGNVPAFFFIRVVTDGLPYTNTYMLDVPTAREFVRLLVSLYLKETEDICVVTPYQMVSSTDSIPELQVYKGVEIEYEHLGGTCSNPLAIEYEC